jgi:RNA polymerase sigma-70 factor (ECF subfamily)
MSANLLDDLLSRLSRGDTDAAEQVFRAYEPYLRTIVRRQLSAALRAKFDSIDVVQSVWADVVKGLRDAAWEFLDTSRLRAFLIKMTRNRFLDRVRQHRRALDREQPLAEGTATDLPAPSCAQPSEVASARELWEQMLALCPPSHHDILRLKRQGLSLEEIAAQTGYHPSSIRRILYDLARRLSAQRSSSPSSPSSAGTTGA